MPQVWPFWPNWASQRCWLKQDVISHNQEKCHPEGEITLLSIETNVRVLVLDSSQLYSLLWQKLRPGKKVQSSHMDNTLVDTRWLMACCIWLMHCLNKTFGNWENMLMEHVQWNLIAEDLDSINPASITPWRICMECANSCANWKWWGKGVILVYQSLAWGRAFIGK